MLYGFSKDSVARIWRAVLAVERYLLAGRAARSGKERTRRPPRTYRRFALSAQLDAGSSAAVEWDDGSAGTVYTPNTNAYGLEGETGEAYPAVDSAGRIQWRVSQNPGQGVYKGSLAADATSTGSVNVTITIDGMSRTVAAQLRADPGTNKKWSSGATCYVGHFRGSWEIISITECPASAT